MNLNDYLDAWSADAKLSPDELDADARNVPLLHAKWWRYYVTERLTFRKLELEYKTLYRQKYDWYAGKMDDDERIALQWEPQPLRLRQTGDISRHLDADPDIQRANTRRAYVEETLRFLEDVIKAINKRGFDIKNSIDFLKFKMGV
jgi:hypothetical protein